MLVNVYSTPYIVKLITTCIVYLYNNSNIVKSKNNTKIPKYSKPLSENRIQTYMGFNLNKNQLFDSECL